MPFLIDADKPLTRAWIMALFGTALVTALAYLLSWCIEHWGRKEKLFVDCMLHDLGKDIWRANPQKLDGPIQQHRITLFQLRPRNWLVKRLRPKWTHVLVPQTRDPKAGRRPTRRFRVHDHHTENCEGICGLAFAMGSVISPALPDLHAEGPLEAGTFEEYTKSTRDSLSKVKKERYYSRVIGGITILDHQGERWGVLVMDSVDPTALDQKAFDHSPARRVLGVLSKVLSEARR